MDKWEDVIKLANKKLAEGYGPACGNNETFKAIPGETDGVTYYAIIVDSNEKPVDWYCKSEDYRISGGFGGFYRMNYDEFIKSCPWVAKTMREIAYYA